MIYSYLFRKAELEAVDLFEVDSQEAKLTEEQRHHEALARNRTGDVVHTEKHHRW